MKYRNVVSFAFTLIGMSGLLFQTSCKSKHNTESAYDFASVFANIENQFETDNDLKFAIAIANDKKNLPTVPNTDVTVTYEVVDTSRATIDNNGKFNLLKRASTLIEVKVTLTKGKNDTKTQKMMIPTATGIEVANHYADKVINLKDLKISIKKVDGNLRTYSVEPTATASVLMGDTLVLPTLDDKYKDLGLCIVAVDQDTLNTGSVGEKEIKLRIDLKEDGSVSSSKSQEETWHLKVMTESDFNNAEIEIIVKQAQEIAAQAVETANQAVTAANPLNAAGCSCCCCSTNFRCC